MTTTSNRPTPSPSLFLMGVARRLGLEPSGYQTSMFEVDGHRILSMVVRVTPDLARRWLEANNAPEVALRDQLPAGHTDLQPNRRLSGHITEQYLRQIQDGRWMVSHQNVIAFDPNGFLLDGQHRLAAIAQADFEDEEDAGLTFRVELGWPRAAFAALDSGLRRSAHQLLRTPDSMQIIGAVRILAAITGQANPGQRKPGDPYRADADNGRLLAWEEFWQPEIRGLVAETSKAYAALRMNKSTHLAVLTLAARTAHAPMIESWIKALVEGSGLSATNPVLHLRNRLSREQDRRALSTSTHDRLVLYIKAWNAHATGRPVAVLKVGSAEPVPPVVGFDYTSVNG